MTRGVNKVILLGNVGTNPEKKVLPSGNPVTTLSLATTESWKDKQTGERQDKTEWHRVVCFNKLAEIAGDYIRKGSKIYVEGSIRTRKWQDQQGQDRYSTEIIANDIQMLDSKAASTANGYEDIMPMGDSAFASQAPMKSATSQPAPVDALDIMDDDIPF